MCKNALTWLYCTCIFDRYWFNLLDMNGANPYISHVKKSSIINCVAWFLQVSCVSKRYSENCTVSTNGYTYSTVIDNLRQDREYEIKVAAWTKAGLGAWSDSFVFGMWTLLTFSLIFVKISVVMVVNLSCF